MRAMVMMMVMVMTTTTTIMMKPMTTMTTAMIVMRMMMVRSEETECDGAYETMIMMMNDTPGTTLTTRGGHAGKPGWVGQGVGS